MAIDDILENKDENAKSFMDGIIEQPKASGGYGSAAATEKEQSVIGKNIKFRGELVGTENLHIEGTIEGTVIMEGHDLSVGAGGELNANIHAKNIVVEGQLTGDALADELIEIRRTAAVKGNLIAPRIKLDDGGKFRGSMDMVDTDSEMKERHKEFKEKLVHPNLPPAEAAKQASGKKSGSAFDSKIPETPSFTQPKAGAKEDKKKDDQKEKEE
ncbi:MULTISPECIES: bactofilin family protein [Microbulbifer]|uniref:bactofilin family protein n=1 Tax=Microbulbifer TaxID=48073 RepID=UPI001E49C2B9|nr:MULTISPECIES: polymer-forming cytoskeletal protein [Microbulbifer]UHQ54466.1 polymer-forming cytoskeletal protein [Microbulbifer sp. YPW16]